MDKAREIALKHIPTWVAENIVAGEKTFISEFNCMLAAMAEYTQHQQSIIDAQAMEIEKLRGYLFTIARWPDMRGQEKPKQTQNEIALEALHGESK